MRWALSVLSPLLALLLTSYGVTASPSPTIPKARLGRFVLGGRSESDQTVLQRNLTSNEIHARELTHRRPTRRSTAQRRQTSDLPPEPNNVNAVATSGGEPVGELRLSEDVPAGERRLSGVGPTIGNVGAPVSLQYSASPSWTSRTDQQIEVLDPPEFAGYPYLGWSYVLAGDSGERIGYLSPTDIGAAEITMASVATPPGSTPKDLPHFSRGTTLGLETDVWTIDYLTSELSVVWTNPDGSQNPVYIVSNGVKTYITGNPAGMSPSYGTGFTVIQMHSNPI